MRKLLIVIVALMATLFLASCGTPIDAEPELGSISDLENMEQLRTLFNQDISETRLVLLLSPT